MLIGTQIYAKDGYKVLLKGVTYHFLKNDHKLNKVFLTVFGGYENSKPTAGLIVMNRNQFEEGVAEGKIEVCPGQLKMPPWLSDLEDIDLSLIDNFRPSAKKSHTERVSERFMFISNVLQQMDEIFKSENPELEINRWARKCDPVQNESRFRLWLLTYLSFGHSQWVLLPPFHRSGQWNRFKYPDKKFGNTSLAFGKYFGFGSNQDSVDKCIEGYIKYAKLGKTLTSIYRLVMTDTFGCRIKKIPSPINAKQMIDFYEHPHGDRFPSLGQFKYRVIQKFGIELVHKALYGQVRHRTKLAPSQGSFSSAVANLMERIEADGYYTKERPKGYLNDSYLNPLCVVRARDYASGLLLGIGFSLNKERSEAYRMMLFSMAIPKVLFCRLFGITIQEEDWPSEGLPPFFGVDRGPGAKRDLIAELEDRFPIKDIAPSYSGQSKATIESSHPKHFKSEGEPSYIKSNLTPVELARKEIKDTVMYNQMANMSGRMQPNPEMAYVRHTPIELWNFYAERFRSDAQPISLEDAVKTFLTKVELTVKNDGIWMKGQKYDSKELRETDVLDSVVGGSSVKAHGYCLDLTTRYIWVELKGRLLMLEAQMRIRDDENILYVSLSELEQWEQLRNKVSSEHRVASHATASRFQSEFETDTGKSYDHGTIVFGVPKKNPINHSLHNVFNIHKVKRKSL